MAYDITKTNGESLVTLDEKQPIDKDTLSGVGLIAKLTVDYGETQSENFVHLAENFANISFPEHPITGQLCYKTDEQCLYVCKNTEGNPKWEKMLTILTNLTDGNTYQLGDLYFDIEENSLQIYNDGQWVKIGPENYNVKSSFYISKDNIAGNVEIPFDKGSVGLMTMKIVATEVFDKDNPQNGIKQPQCSAWIYKCLVQKYANKYVIVGTPSYELIGRTDGAINWKVTFGEFKDNLLQIDVDGDVEDSTSTIHWTIEGEIVRV